MIRQGVLSAIGHTPLVQLERLYPQERFHLYAKLEGCNPCGSIKDRTAMGLLECGFEQKLIGPDTTIIESSSGNLGLGLAQACCYFGLPFICVVDPRITQQNLRLLRAYGAQIEMVELPDPISGEFLPARIERISRLRRSIPDSYWPDQYSNPANPRAQQQTMQEIVEQLSRPPDFLFCAVSTCGTLRGCCEFLQGTRYPTELVAVDAENSVIFGHCAGKRLIPGHGAALVPKLFSPSLATRCVHVSDPEAIIGCRRLLRREALLVGGSSGAVISAFDRLRHEIPAHASCVVIFPDRGERYLDTIYNDAWIEETLEAPARAAALNPPRAALNRPTQPSAR